MANVHPLPDPVALAEALAELVVGSDERDQQIERIKCAWSEGWLAGHQIGYEGGYAQAERDAARRWKQIADPIARGGPSHSELERRRWMLRGEQRTRGAFAQPHPDDFLPSGDAA